MNIDELNAKYDEIYAKNKDIQKLFAEVEDHNEILFYLYDTDIKRHNAALNTMIDSYESLIFKIRESHKDIKDSLTAFGNEKELAQGVTDNGNLTEKVKDLILWKLRRLFMIYDEEPVLPYVNGEFLKTDLIGNDPAAATAPTPTAEATPEPAAEGMVAPEDEEPTEVLEMAEEGDPDEPAVAIEADVPIEAQSENSLEQESEEEDYDRFSDREGVDPSGGIFPKTVEDKN